MSSMVNCKQDVLNKEFVYGYQIYRTSPDGEWQVEDNQTKHNLVTYDGRDFIAQSVGFEFSSIDYFINLVAVGVGVKDVAITDTELTNLIPGTYGDYKVIDTKVPASLSQRGLIIFEGKFIGSDFTTSYSITEAGLFIASNQAPTVPATYTGNDWMFARVNFETPFVVQPWDEVSGLERGLILKWYVQF